MRARLEGDYVTLPPPIPADVTDTMSPENLDSQHLGALKGALNVVLHTDLAEFTYAQIADGLPTLSSFQRVRLASGS